MTKINFSLKHRFVSLYQAIRIQILGIRNGGKATKPEFKFVLIISLLAIETPTNYVDVSQHFCFKLPDFVQNLFRKISCCSNNVLKFKTQMCQMQF